MNTIDLKKYLIQRRIGQNCTINRFYSIHHNVEVRIIHTAHFFPKILGKAKLSNFCLIISMKLNPQGIHFQDFPGLSLVPILSLGTRLLETICITYGRLTYQSVHP